MSSSQLIDLIGRRFGRWTVLTMSPEQRRGIKYWQCRCDCGTERLVSGANLQEGVTNSCGCLVRGIPKKFYNLPRQPQAYACDCGDHWWTKLTKSFVTMVSPQDAGLIQDQLWMTSSAFYAVRGSATNRTIQLHREILSAVKDLTGLQVDHKTLNRLDNRRENLRPANSSLNGANRRKPVIAVPKSSFKGVYLYQGPNRRSWVAHCKNKHLGCFATEIEAALAYDNAARKKYGPFARTNFPIERPS